jgi:hypothetical protein
MKIISQVLGYYNCPHLFDEYKELLYLHLCLKIFHLLKSGNPIKHYQILFELVVYIELYLGNLNRLDHLHVSLRN